MEDNEQDGLKSIYTIIIWIVSTVVLFAMGFIFYQFRWILYTFGIICCTCAIALVVEFTIRRITRYTYRDISQTGTIAKPFIGKPKTFAPISLLPASKEPTVKVTPVVPTLKEMLAKQLLDGVSLYHGYEIKGSEVIPLIGSWNDVRTFAIAGKGGSGKTIRLFFILIQCILAGAKIYLCDPHGSDAGSITALLQPLAKWIKFAVTDFEGDIEAQIMAMVSDFHARMERRRHNQEVDRTPCVLVIDEFTSLIMNDLYGESVVDTVCACADQYRKYGGYAVVVGQSWTLPAKGKTTALLARLRKSLHAMFVHRLHADYAKYFFSDRKRLKGIDHLKTGLCVFVDTDGQLHDIHTPKGSVTDAFTVASMMQALPGSTTDQLQLTSPRLKEQVGYPFTRNVYPETNGFRDDFKQAETHNFIEYQDQLSLPSPGEINQFSSRDQKKAEIVRLKGLSLNQSQIIYHIWQARPGETQAYKEALAAYKSLLDEIVRSA